MSDEQAKAFHFKVGGVEVDFTNIPPLTVGDKKRLKTEGVDFMRYARERVIDPDDEAKLVLHLIRKLRKETTSEEVDEIPALVASSFLQYAVRRSAEVDDPFSTRSTSLERPTVGASASSGDEPKPN